VNTFLYQWYLTIIVQTGHYIVEAFQTPSYTKDLNRLWV